MAKAASMKGASRSPHGADVDYSEYARLREAAQVQVTEAAAGPRFCLYRYDDVLRALQDRRFGAARAAPLFTRALRLGGFSGLADVVESGVLVNLDPPHHTRLRRVVGRFFRRSSIAGLRARIEAIAHGLIDALPCDDAFDLVEHYAAPLPIMVIAELFGFPEEDLPRLKAWSDDLTPLIDSDLQLASLVRAVRAFDQFRTHVDAAIEARRRDPREDLLSALAHARHVTAELTAAECAGTAAFVLAAGHETTTHVIASGMLTLLEHPQELERLRDHPDRVTGAVEEMLRFESPIQRTGRVLHEEIDIGGRKIPKGAKIRLVIGAANRDPRRFVDPDRFDIGRTDNPHLAFGAGPHHCMGSSLARLELDIALNTLLQRMPRLRRDARPPEWMPGTKVRGLRRLPVKAGGPLSPL
jgi:cytochrome P450